MHLHTSHYLFILFQILTHSSNEMALSRLTVSYILSKLVVNYQLYFSRPLSCFWHGLPLAPLWNIFSCFPYFSPFLSFLSSFLASLPSNPLIWYQNVGVSHDPVLLFSPSVFLDKLISLYPIASNSCFVLMPFKLVFYIAQSFFSHPPGNPAVETPSDFSHFQSLRREDLTSKRSPALYSSHVEYFQSFFQTSLSKMLLGRRHNHYLHFKD